MHNNRQFSTEDRKRDIAKAANCAAKYKGAWWFRSCFHSHLNGEYHRNMPEKKGEGIMWHAWKGLDKSLASTEMKIRKIASWSK